MLHQTNIDPTHESPVEKPIQLAFEKMLNQAHEKPINLFQNNFDSTQKYTKSKGNGVELTLNYARFKLFNNLFSIRVKSLLFI